MNVYYCESCGSSRIAPFWYADGYGMNTHLYSLRPGDVLKGIKPCLTHKTGSKCVEENLPILLTKKGIINIADCCYSCVFARDHGQSREVPYIVICQLWEGNYGSAHVRWYNTCHRFKRRRDDEI